ncbi:GNAT family N-acetyltransferase [Georgenia sp. EYE_87]|nr:GNAT family N-acetyltransferase [Georgenia sp. EYE_87]
MDLPGFTTRPLSLADAAAVVDVVAAEELRSTGEVAIEVADVVADWQRPSFDVASGTLGVLDGDRLVAFAEYSGEDRSDAAVHPDHHGRGIGTALAGWIRDRARAAGARTVGMPVFAGSPGDRLLGSLGYRVRWTSWVLALPAGREIVPQPVPAGYTVREATPADHRAVWTTVEDAFLEWSDRARSSYEDFAARVMDRPGFEPWNLRVAVAPDRQVVGAAFVVRAGDVGYVDKLAVRADQRGRGLARALLVDAFSHSRAHGAGRAELSTDSRTGALALYEKVGMEVTQVWLNRAVDL